MSGRASGKVRNEKGGNKQDAPKKPETAKEQKL